MATEIGPDGSLTIIRGDDVRIPLEFVEDDGVTPIDMTGCSFRAQVRSKPNGYIVLSLTGMNVDFPNGKFTLYALPANTSLIRLTEAWWDLEVTWGSGVVETVIGPAPVEIIKDITV